MIPILEIACFEPVWPVLYEKHNLYYKIVRIDENDNNTQIDENDHNTQIEENDNNTNNSWLYFNQNNYYNKKLT